MTSILYIGCPTSERAETEQALASAGLSLAWADTVSAALGELRRCEMPVLVDLSRGGAALQVVRDLRTQRPSLLVFAVVDGRRPDLTAEAVLAGMADVFERPLGARRVATAIARELESDRGAGRHAVEITSDDLYHQSQAMREVMAAIARAASTRAGVLIRGEDGTGRQVVARAIHAAHATGSAANFVCFDCAAHDTELLDAELFGTSARSAPGDSARGIERVSRNSRLHDALGGTLYLQNVAEAPTRVQARLARLLRDREALLSEAGTTVDLDVRPMAGVDPGFDRALQEGRVREDLFRRLSVIGIDLPALRNRREDIPALANFFVRDVCATLRIPPKTLSRPALSLITALPWRGNASELRTLLESVVSGLAGPRGIGLEDVLAHVRLDSGAMISPTAGTLRQAKARFEREYIAAVLDQHHGRISDAAKALGIQRTNLYRKMRSLRVARTSRGSHAGRPA